VPETMEELLKKFEQEHEVYVDAQDAKSYWMVNARLPKKQESLHNLHRARKYVTSRNKEGIVLVLPNPAISDSYSLETWGTMDTFRDFVEKALARILEDLAGSDLGGGECERGCN
jgi:hypothetical protein